MSRRTDKRRADVLLVERGLVESRERAQALIMEGVVYTPAGKVIKPGAPMSTDTPLEVREGPPYVGRGGVKLAHALERFGLDVSDWMVLDVGASTGGFTDCLLQRGASRAVALDVGHGQLDYRLRRDPRVEVMERINARYDFDLPQGMEGELVSLATVDVSFISATKVIPSVGRHVRDGGYLIVLVKPQFEAARGEVGRGGVIKDPKVHAGVLGKVILWAVETGFRLRGLAPSPILGNAGNREFFLLFQK